MRRQCQHTLKRDAGAIPLEDQRSMRLEHSEAFAEAIGQHRFPVSEQSPIHLGRAGVFVKGVEVGRIEGDQVECIIRECERGEVAHDIGRDFHCPVPVFLAAVRLGFVRLPLHLFASAVVVECHRVPLVEPHLPGSAAHIQDRRKSRTRHRTQ